MSKLQLADPISSASDNCDIDILLGSDYYLDVIRPERRELRPGLYVINSRLGWILCGRLPRSVGSHDHFQPTPSLLVTSQPSATLSPGLPHAFCDIQDSPSTSYDDAARTFFEQSILKVESRHYVRWPWKPGHDPADRDNRDLV